MKLITDINLELVIQEFYNRISEEFKTADKLSEGRTLTIGETGKVFDGSQDVFWSLNEIGAVSNGTISNLTTTNKTVVTAINELQSKKASIAYVDNAIENVTIDDAVTAVELIGNVEDVEFDFVTQEELDEALANFDDFDIEGMVTAVDVGDVNIDGGTGGQGGSSSGITVNSTYVNDANYANTGYYPTNDQTLNLPPECYNAEDDNYSLWGILFTQVEPKYNTIVQQYIPTWGAWANTTFTRTWNNDAGFTSWAFHLDSGEWTYSLETNNKTIIGAINELFQSANNGKELIASAIGEPLNAEDTFSAMSNDINGLLNTFKTNMMNNGVTVNSSDRFKQLIDKISTMVEEGSGKGIQFASGQIDSDYYTFANASSTHTFNFNEPLNFTPTYLFIRIPYVRYSSDNGTAISRNTIVSNLFNNSIDEATQLRIGCSGSDSVLNIKSTSSSNFVIEGDIDIAFGYSSSTGYDSDYYIDWYAFGVGEEDTTLRDSLASILQEEGVSVSNEDDMASLISKVDSEFDRQIVPQGTATINDVISGKTFINSTGQLLTGTASKGLSTATGTVNVSSTIYTSKSFTINANFTPTRLILIIPKVWYDSGTIEHQNVVVTNGTTTTLNAGAGQNGTIKISSMTATSFNIQMSSLQIPSCTITWIAFG